MKDAETPEEGKPKKREPGWYWVRLEANNWIIRRFNAYGYWHDPHQNTITDEVWQEIDERRIEREIDERRIERSHSHTEQPGDSKWKIEYSKYSTYCNIIDADGYVGTIQGREKAELIAKAPEMAAELEQLRSERDKMMEARALTPDEIGLIIDLFDNIPPYLYVKDEALKEGLLKKLKP